MPSAQSEPSMDEILASIRRIISEEDEETNADDSTPKTTLTLDDAVEVSASDALTETAEAMGGPSPTEDETSAEDVSTEETAVAPHPVDDFSGAEAASDDVTADSADELMKNEEPSMTQPEAAPDTAPFEEESSQAAVAAVKARVASLVSETAATTASSAFGSLEHNVRVSTGGGRTIEDIIESMLAPMLSEWLDNNLPRIVEEKVEDEVRRIARRR